MKNVMIFENISDKVNSKSNKNVHSTVSDCVKYK